MNKEMTHTDQTEPTLFDELAFIEKIESLIRESESTEVEFKSGKGGFPSSLWETYSSFANTQGGVIVLGVKEQNHRFSIDHLTKDDIQKYKKIFWDNVNNKQQVSVNILKDDDVQEGEFNGGYLLVLNVPRADRRQKPVFLKGNPDNTYKRNHEGDYKCTPDEMRRMFADADMEHPKDSRILAGFSVENDIDLDSLNQYRRLASAIHPDHPWLQLEPKELLVKLGGYRMDKSTKEAGVTLAGILMFGKGESIKDINACPAYFPDYREYLSSDPMDRWTNRVYPDGTWEANLFQFYMKVYSKLAFVLPKPFVLENGIRKDETPTHIALREAFINTLIHCDYTVDSNITIELRRDKYVFSNPGSLLISISQYYHGGESVCRNKSLQQMFMLMGAAEKAGSGVDKILQGWKMAKFRSPKIIEKTKPEKVVLELPLVSLLSEEVINYLKDVFGNEIEMIAHDKLLTLATCCTEGEVTNNRLQLVIEKHSTEITKMLKELCTASHLIAEGVGRGTRYKINKAKNSASNKENVASNKENVASNKENVASNKENVASNQQKNVRYLKKEKLCKIIFDICISDFLSLDEIAQQTQRSIRYLKNYIIPEMVSSGMLEREFPNVPKHRKQRYKAKL